MLLYLFKIIYLTVLYVVVMFLVPLGSLIILNYKLMTVLRRTRRKRDTWRSHRNVSRRSSCGEQTTSGGNSRSEDDITRMLIVVVLVFVISQSPALITQAVVSLAPDEPNDCPHPLFFYVRLSDLLIVANSSLNFIVYSFCSRRFRQILIELVRCRHDNESTRRAGHVTRSKCRSQCPEVGTGRQRAQRVADAQIGQVRPGVVSLKAGVETVDGQLASMTSHCNIVVCDAVNMLADNANIEIV